MWNKRRHRGLTIIELVVFMVIIGVAAAGILQVMNLATKNSADPARRKQALLIAEAYMEEVQQAQFTVCEPTDPNAATAVTSADCSAGGAEAFGPEAGNSRPFDNINDYVPSTYAFGQAVRAFAVADSSGKLVDRDVNGNPLGVNAAGGTLGNVALSDYTTTLTLRNGTGLGGLNSSTSDPTIYQITITVTYGPGESVTLDGYRTRYQPSAR